MFGADEFKRIFDRYSSRDIILYGDPDVDGLISLLLMCQFCDMLGLQYRYHVNEHRYHGFDLPVGLVRGKLVIAADFSISKEELESLVDDDVVLLSTDHHEIGGSFVSHKSATAEGIIINNQYPFESAEKRYLSGAGVFFELICELFPEFDTEERRGLVGITLLSDICEIENKLARKYLRTTYRMDATKGYVKYLIDSVSTSDFSFGAPKLDRNFIDYNLSPYVNALLRANRTMEATNFILGFSKASGTDARELQRSLIRDMYARGECLELDSIAFLKVTPSEFMDYDVDITGYIGLFCSDYKDKHKNKSTLGMVVDNGKVIRASFRGKYDDIAYRSSFINLGIKTGGHANAFGIKDFHPTENTWQELDDLIYELELNHEVTYTVVNASNLAIVLNTKGTELAMNNCYTRDMYRTYIRYTGRNAKIIRQTFRMHEVTEVERLKGVQPDVINKNKSYIYDRDDNGKPIVKYIEYLVDGRKVKSFGVPIDVGLILPIMERGYMTLYVREVLE